MIDAVADLIDAGRVKLYCVDSADAWTWSDRSVPIEERARRHDDYEAWVRGTVVAVDRRRLRRAARDHHARLQPRRVPRGELRAQARARVPARDRAVGQLRPDHLARVGRAGRRDVLQQPDGLRGQSRGRSPRLAARAGEPCCWSSGQGAWEVSPTGALPSTQRLAAPLAGKGIRHELDVWGYDVPHDWPSWQRATCATTCRASARKVIVGTIASDRTAARHRGRLADRVRGAGAAGRHGHRRRRHRARLRRRARHDRAVRPARQTAPRPGHRPARLLVLPPAGMAEEGRTDGRRLPAQQPVHVPEHGEARRVLRDDAARAARARHRPRPVQEPARAREVRLHRRAVQPSVRPRRHRRPARLPDVHEALRRRRVGGRQPDPQQRGAAPRLRRVGPAAHAPAEGGRRVRRVRPQPVHRRRDDGDELRPRPADARALLGSRTTSSTPRPATRR